MRVRPQSYLLPAALLVLLFFYNSAYSEKKNRTYGEDADREVNFNNENYKNRAAGSNGDIISFNSKHQKDDYAEFSDIKENSKSMRKKELKNGKKSLKKNNSGQASGVDTLIYIVKSGDTLFSIAERSGVSLKKIQEINDLNDSTRIYKGMKLQVPADKVSRKKNIETSEKNAVSSKPVFLWPLKKIKGYARDGKDGVKSIGIIIKGNPGSEVIASDQGVVKKVGYMRGYGKYIVVKHGKRYITVYSNLMDVSVRAGDAVEKGGRIGNISDDMTLHFQIDHEGKPENPLNLLPERG